MTHAQKLIFFLVVLVTSIATAQPTLNSAYLNASRLQTGFVPPQVLGTNISEANNTNPWVLVKTGNRTKWILSPLSAGGGVVASNVSYLASAPITLTTNGDGSVTIGASLAGSYEVHVAELTNTVYGTNVDGAPILWVGATNQVTLNNGYQTYVTSTGYAFTNLIKTREWATIIVSNTAGTSVTGTVAIANLRLLGPSTTNSLVTPAGKVAVYSFQAVAGISNHVNLVQQ